jgi:hypothetical protein
MIYIVVRHTTDWNHEATFGVPYHLAVYSAALRVRQDRARAHVPLDRLL